MEGEWYVYVVECDDGTLYTGITTDLERRLHEHNHTSKGADYTRSRRPVELRAAWPHESQGDALRAEDRFKKLNREQKINRIRLGLTPESRESLARVYLETFPVDDASRSDVHPIALAGEDGERRKRARRYDRYVTDHLDTLREHSAPLGDVADRVESRFAAGPGVVDGHGFVIDGAPVVFFDMQFVDRHLEEEDFRPSVHVAHELTHALHYGLQPAFEPRAAKSPAEEIWHRLVAEGMAIRVSEEMTDCSPRHSTWFGYLEASAFKTWRSNARTLRDRLPDMWDLDRSLRFEDALWERLFQSGGDDPEATRLGYWWGRRIVERAERDRIWEELIAAPPTEWRPYVRGVIGWDDSNT